MSLARPGEARRGQDWAGQRWALVATAPVGGLAPVPAAWLPGCLAGCRQLFYFFLFLLKESRLAASLGLPPAPQLPGRKFFHRNKIVFKVQ